ncbi:17379_t:CDS:2, partial [Cetraspora pellucida]
IKDNADTNSNESTDTYISDESEIRYKTSEIFDFQDIVNKMSKFTNNYNQIVKGNKNDKISEEICSNDSELNNTNHAEFLNTAYRDFIDI